MAKTRWLQRECSVNALQPAPVSFIIENKDIYSAQTIAFTAEQMQLYWKQKGRVRICQSNFVLREPVYRKKNYMVDISGKVDRIIKEYVEKGRYFTINRARQYGKTTTLSRIINGTGNYYIEAQTRDNRRTDIVIDYKGRQFIVELKIWRGNEYNLRAEEQVFRYLEFYKQDKGYLLSFNFNKHKKTGVHELEYKGKRILEVVV